MRPENDLLLGSKPKSYNSIPEAVGVRKPSTPDGTVIREEKPDGGWGWLVVFGVALSNMTTQSVISVFGLLFIERLEELKITTGGASLMMGMQITALNLSGLITGPVIKKFSYRKTAIAGAVLVMIGLVLTTHADSLMEFVLTYSLFTGLGLGLLYPATFVAIDSYFSKKRGRAVGLSLTGTGIGQMLLPLLVEFLLDVYDFNGTLLILAGIASHSILGATFYQPVKWHMKRVEIREPITIETQEEPQKSEHLSTGTKKKKGLLSRISSEMDIELMKNPSFANLVVGLALVYTANMCFSMLFPFYLESINYSLDDVALSMSVLSGADIIGRLIVPVFTDGFHMKSKSVFFIGAALSAVARSGLVFPMTFVQTLVLVGLCGIIRAALICNFNISISEQTTPDKLPSALGLHMIFKGLAMMVFAPVVGFVRDYTKSYAYCMHILSVFFLAVPFFAWLVEYIFVKIRNR